jgi:hypothetical protein
MIVTLVFISGYYISVYWWLLVVIDGYFINGYCILSYYCLLYVTLQLLVIIIL